MYLSCIITMIGMVRNEWKSGSNSIVSSPFTACIQNSLIVSQVSLSSIFPSQEPPYLILSLSGFSRCCFLSHGTVSLWSTQASRITVYFLDLSVSSWAGSDWEFVMITAEVILGTYLSACAAQESHDSRLSVDDTAFKCLAKEVTTLDLSPLRKSLVCNE